MTKITFISDTHSKHAYCTPNLPGGDILIHSGDISSMGHERELYDFLKWFSKQKYEHKVFIAGNHDWIFERNPARAQEILSEYLDVIYLQDNSVELEGLKIYGSPWQPAFHNWAFNLPRNGEALDEKWAQIPEDVDILVTHGPPFETLDYVIWSQSSVGCERMAKHIPRIKPMIHAFGHIHGAGTSENNYTFSINASVLNEKYDYTFKPTVVEVENKIVTLIDNGYAK
jgi:Icc-related predicted phosphoesterase